MAEAWPAVTAAWLGLVTAMSPCPLAANLAAVAYLGRLVGHPGTAVWHGCCFAAGRTVAYLLVAAGVVSGLLAAPATARWLQRSGDPWLGGLLLVTGVLVLGSGRWPAWGGGFAGRGRWLADHGGAPGAFALGGAFALAFCPVSAALFFGSLIPLAVREREPILLPVVFGLATGFPVVGLALALMFGAAAAARAFRAATAVERWARPVTGVTLIGIGVFLCTGRPAFFGF